MPLSKNIIDKVNADHVAINYEPMSIGSQLSEEAMEYVNNEESRGDFRVDKIVAEYVGIEELEKETQQKEVAKQALILSKEVQESAYEEAYALGLKEGEEKAYAEEKQRIEEEMQTFKKLIDEVKIIKTELIKQNEKQIVNLCFYMAKRLLMKEVKADVEYVKTLIRKTLEMAQSEEEVVIRVCSQDKHWLDAHQDSVFNELHLDPMTRIEEDNQVNRGGIIVETHHGVIDSTIEQRLDKLEAIVKSQA